MRTEFFRLDVLTPVHIGTGDEVDPMSYLMSREDSGSVCHILDTNAWAADYPDHDELSAKFSGGNIPQMRKFIAESIDPAIYGIRRIHVSDPAIFQEYESKRDDQRTSNQLRISPQLSSNGHAPILPGSSLKGAIRTAVIDWLDREQRLSLKHAPTPRDYTAKLEAALGRITESAFKQLKISDVQGWADSTQLVEAREIRRKEGKAVTPKSKCEVLPSQAQGEMNASTLYGKLALGSPTQANNARLSLPSGTSWSWNELAALVNAYLIPRLDAEIDKFFLQPHFAKSLPLARQLRQAIAEAKPGEMFLRVGHYSQVEFVTVRDNQPLTRRGKDGKPLPHGTTRTLANGLLPFGWVKITLCDEEEYRLGVSRSEAALLNARRRRDRALAEVLAHKERLLQLQREQEASRLAKEAAERQRALEEERRKAAMTPLERSILEVIEADSDPNKRPGAKLLTALKAGKWAEEEARVVAEKIKNEMVAEKKWKETTEKKNPQKDHDHQKTLEVLKFLRS